MITGLTLKNSIISGANNLSNRRAKVDELNVFPVPDGDTGTNMGMTIGAARTELLNLPDDCTVEKGRAGNGQRHAARRARQLRRYFQPAVPRLFQGAAGQKNSRCKGPCAGAGKKALRVHTRP